MFEQRQFEEKLKNIHKQFYKTHDPKELEDLGYDILCYDDNYEYILLYKYKGDVYCSFYNVPYNHVNIFPGKIPVEFKLNSIKYIDNLFVFNGISKITANGYQIYKYTYESNKNLENLLDFFMNIPNTPKSLEELLESKRIPDLLSEMFGNLKCDPNYERYTIKYNDITYYIKTDDYEEAKLLLKTTEYIALNLESVNSRLLNDLKQKLLTIKLEDNPDSDVTEEDITTMKPYVINVSAEGINFIYDNIVLSEEADIDLRLNHDGTSMIYEFIPW